MVASNLKAISFENKQKLLRIVLDKVVVNDSKLDVYYNIPLPKPPAHRQQKKCQPNSIYVPHVILCAGAHKMREIFMSGSRRGEAALPLRLLYRPVFVL